MQNLMKGVSILTTHDISAMEKYLLPDGEYKIPLANAINKYKPTQIRQFGHVHGMYQLPTKELVDFLSAFVIKKETIEVGSGVGVLGKALRIPCTDSKMQERPEVKALYTLMKQPVIKYGAHVAKLDYSEALDIFKPSVVIGSWLTGKVDINGNPLNMFGFDEETILEKVDTYIMVGNHSVHKTKDILKYPHRRYTAPWIVSRSEFPELNSIYIWSKNPIQIDADKFKMKLHQST